MDWRVAGVIPGQGTCVGCGFGPGQGMCERQPIAVSLSQNHRDHELCESHPAHSECAGFRRKEPWGAMRNGFG